MENDPPISPPYDSDPAGDKAPARVTMALTRPLRLSTAGSTCPIRPFAILLCLFLFLPQSAAVRGAELPKLLIGGDRNCPPYEFLRDNRADGFNIELMRAVAEVMGFQPEFRLDVWNKSRRALERGEIDALAGMFFSEERGRDVDFSIPHTLVTPALFVPNRSGIRSFRELNGKRIVVQEGDVFHDLLVRGGITSRITPAQDPLQALRLLVSGNGDCLLSPSKMQGEYLIRQYGFTGVRALATDLPQLKYCFAVRKGNQELLFRLDEGLNILKANGSYQKIYHKWFGIHEKREMWREIRPVVLALIVVAALLIASFLWSRSLQRLVRKRTAELMANESELRQAHAALEQRVAQRTADLAELNHKLLTEIGERAQIEEGLRSTNQRLDLLAEMASRLLMSDSPLTAVDALCRRVLDFLGCDIFFNYLVDEKERRLHLNACSGISADGAAGMEWLDLGVGLCGCAARDGVRLVVNDLQNSNDRYTALVRRFGVTAYACHPLISHDRILGTLSFCSRSKSAFDDDDLSLMKTVADHVAIAIQRSLADEQIRLRQEEMEELNRTLDQRVREEVAQNRHKDIMLIRQNRHAALGEMLDHIAHQWKQPLNSISLIIQDLGQSWVHDELEEGDIGEAVDRTMALVEHMSQTINVFRDFYQPEKEKKVFRIKESIDGALTFISPSLRIHSIVVELNVDPALSAFGYPREYSQVLLNILANARDAFKVRGIERPRMTISAYQDKNVATVTITDNAGGIHEAIIDRIFDLYFTTNEEGGGSGIGLYMSKNIIEKNMGGLLSVENVDNGARFRIQVGMA